MNAFHGRRLLETSHSPRSQWYDPNTQRILVSLHATVIAVLWQAEIRAALNVDGAIRDRNEGAWAVMHCLKSLVHYSSIISAASTMPAAPGKRPAYAIARFPVCAKRPKMCELDAPCILNTHVPLILPLWDRAW